MIGLFTGGVRTRTLTQANYAQLAFGGYTLDVNTSGPPYNVPVISLFNDSNPPSPLTLITINTMCGGGISVVMDMVQGTFGSLAMQGVYARDPRTAADGQIYQTVLTSGAFNNPGPTFPGLQTFATGGFTPVPIIDTPMFTLPPGYSFRFAPDVTFGGMAIGLWWLVGEP